MVVLAADAFRKERFIYGGLGGWLLLYFGI
jgi:hypothetical protein